MDFRFIRIALVYVILAYILHKARACGNEGVPKICRLRNAHWHDCANEMCQDTCADPQKSSSPSCQIKCCFGGCKCNPNYIRAYEGGPCIRKKIATSQRMEKMGNLMIVNDSYVDEK